jgi:hypothetical protein
MNKKEKHSAEFTIDCLPSYTRLCINVIAIPLEGSCDVVKPFDPTTFSVEGLVLGSISTPIFDQNFVLQ